MARRNRSEDPERQRQQKFTGARIRLAREEMRLSQVELGQALGYSNATISDIERGVQGLDAHDLQRLSRITGQPMEFFTNPDYLARPAHTPRTQIDWLALFPGEPWRAQLHYEVEVALRRAVRTGNDGGSGSDS
jgi:transcriptional regulator with XRE-family HTH domain